VQRRYRAVRAILSALFLCTAFRVGEAQAQPAQIEPAQAQASADTIARGKALANAGDCTGCHTADSAKPLAGGKRIETPFGGIYSANLTPDRATGLGGWSDEDFYQALRNGVAPNGSRYYPAFPYPYFSKMTRQDILAIKAYLATLAPVSNTPPPPQLRWPLNYRFLMRGWDWLFFKPGILQPDQQKSAEWNRGRYLVEGAGHCGACHTTKDVFGADKQGHAFGGGLVQDQFAPRLDAAPRSGLNSWSVDDIVEYLQSGRNGRSHAGGLMAEVIVDSTANMSDGDVRAIAVYLKDLPAGTPEPHVVPPTETQMNDGTRIYKRACIACHEVDGSGAPRIYPPLPGNANLQSAIPANTLRIILQGAQTLTTPRAPNTGSMPAYAKDLSDQEIADVATYVRNSWGNSASAVTASQVAAARKAP
jgi:mono/diheme cytochrome c family protein